MGEILGEKVVGMRNLRKMTQKELCKGICSQGTISMIEKGKMLPGIDILIAISIRLNVPITYFIDIIYLENTNLEIELYNQVEKLLLEREFDKVYEIASNELNSKANNNSYIYYFKWLYYLSGYYTKKVRLDEAIKQISKLHQEAPNYELNKNYLLTRIRNSLAVLYATQNEFKKALFYYNKIDLDLIDDQPIFDFNSFKLKVFLNKMKMTYDMHMYQETIEQAQIGIEESVKTGKITYIGDFYYYIGQAYEKLGYSNEEISHQYKRAEMFFEILGKDNTSVY